MNRGDHFFNLYNAKISGDELASNNYLVVDRYASSLGKNEVDKIKANYELDLIAKFGNDYLYKLLGKRSILFVDKEREGELLGYVDFSEMDYSALVGFNSYENGYRWATMNSAILLRNNKNTILQLDLWFPDLSSYDKSYILLEVLIDNEIIDSSQIIKSGKYIKKIPIPDKCSDNEELLLSFRINSKYNPDNGDERELAFVVNKIGLIEGTRE